MFHKSQYTRAFILITALTLSSACSTGDQIGDFSGLIENTELPMLGGPATFDVATWNIEWFGRSSDTTDAERVQIANVAAVISAADLDLWAVQEIVSRDGQLDELLDNLPGYDAVLATDERVVSGSDYYHRAEQKVGLIYKTDAITVTGARLIALAAQSSFGGRPPLEVELTARVAGTEVAMVVIVFHGKAGTGSSDLSRRLAGSNALKSYLDATHPDSHVLLLGDFNDDVDTSIRNGRDSPYKNFVDDSERYWVPTEILSELGVSSTVRHDQMLDHQLVSDELAVYYIAESAAVVELDQYISRYDDTTSNHYPVVASYRWAEELGGPVFMNELLANEPGGSTGHEFIELVNSGDVAIDLSRWTLSDSVRVRHVFADDTVIEPGAALVVFADAAAIPAELENAVAASEGSLSLNNGGDLVRLRDSAEQVVAELEYARDLAGRDGVSMNRDPDGDGTGAFALHDAAGAASSSPGLRRDGRSW